MRYSQKIIPLIVIFAMLASLALPAVAAYPEITLGQQKTVTVVDDESAVIFRFVPPEDGFYRFYSYGNGEVDPYGYIMDENMDTLVSNDDYQNMDFQVSCKLLAGETYYLAATTYSGAAEYLVAVEKQLPPVSMAFAQSNYSGSLNGNGSSSILFYPEGCGLEAVTYTSSDPDVVYVDADGYLYFLYPGTVTISAVSESGLTASCTATTEQPTLIRLDQPQTLYADTREAWQFTAPATGWYGIRSSGDPMDTAVEVYDSAMNQIAYCDDELPGYHFFCPFYLEKGELCYFFPRLRTNTGSCTVTVTTLKDAASVTVPQHLTGYCGDTLELPIAQTPAVSIPERLTWSSDNENVAQVIDDQYVYYRATGSTTLRYTTHSGKTGTVSVTVRSAPTGSSVMAWGSCGPQLLWKLDTKGQLTVTGTGDMSDNQYFWEGYQENIIRVSLPNGITSIGESAFSDCVNLESINLPEGITDIGNAAFAYCYSLNTLTLPQSLKSIGYGAFQYSALTRITFPKNLTELGPYAFSGCEALQKAEFTGGLKQVPMGAFIYCYALTDMELPEGVCSIGDSAFDCSGLQSVTLPSTLETVGYAAFSNCALTELDLPRSLTTVHSCAFYACPLEGELVIPENVAYLGEIFLGYNNLTALHFRGDAPQFHEFALGELSVDAFYSGGNPTWTEDVLQSYGGDVRWQAIAPATVNLSGSLVRANDAAVTLSLSDGTTVTVTAGNYTLSELAPGSLTLIVTAENHVPRTYSLELSVDTRQDITIKLIGDLTGDAEIDVADTGRVYAHARGTNMLTDEYDLSVADVTGDGEVDIADVGRIYAHVRGTAMLF